MLFPSSDVTTLLDKIFPYFLKISCSPALSIDSGKFCQVTRKRKEKKLSVRNPFRNNKEPNNALIVSNQNSLKIVDTLTNKFPIALFLASGSRRDHITLIAFPLSVELFFSSIARIAIDKHHFIVNKINTLRSLSTFIYHNKKQVRFRFH